MYTMTVYITELYQL